MVVTCCSFYLFLPVLGVLRAMHPVLPMCTMHGLSSLCSLCKLCMLCYLCIPGTDRPFAASHLLSLSLLVETVPHINGEREDDLITCSYRYHLRDREYS